MKVVQILLSSALIAITCPLAAIDSADPDQTPVRSLQDIFYAGTDNPRQALNLFLPRKKAGKPLPVVVFIHGGGWKNGDKNSGFRRLQPFLQTGRYAAASVGYRLSDEAQWPAQIHDCKAAIRWIRKHASRYNLDPDRIAVWGTSAGGHLVAMLGTSGDVEDMDGTIGPYPDVSSRVACVVDFFGPTDFLTMNRTAIPGAQLDHDAADSPESLLVGGPIQQYPERVRSASPLTYVSADDPPFLIVHGTRDPLVAFNQSERLQQALTGAGVKNTLITVSGGGHGKGFPGEINGLVSRFLDHHLLGISSEWNDQTVQAVSGQ